MKKASWWMWLGIALYVVAWFIQVEKDGTTLVKGGLPGWEALRVALLPIWHDPGDSTKDSVVLQTLSVLSGLTNLVLVLSPVWISRATSAASIRRTGYVLLVAWVLNLQWLRVGADLRAGYYCWLAAFLALGIGAVRLAGPRSADSAPRR